MDKTGFPNPETIRNELEEGAGICRPGRVPEETLCQSAEEWFLDLARRIGTPVSQSSDGELVLSIRNESYGKNDPRTRGPNTNRKLGFHTDRCDVIGFLCLQPAKKGGENHVVSSLAMERIIRTERPDLHEVLCRPFPTSGMSSTKETTCPTASSRSSRGKRTFSPVPISGCSLTGRTRMTYAQAFRLFRENPWIFSIRYANAKKSRPDSHSNEANCFFSIIGPLFTAELLLRISRNRKNAGISFGFGFPFRIAVPWTNPFGQISGQPKQGRFEGACCHLVDGW